MSLLKSAALAFASLCLASCGALMDTTYLLGDGKTTKVVPASAGIGMSETRIEYAAELGPSGNLDFQCYRRTRGVERGWNVTKTYEYRGGYEKSAYSATAAVDLVIGGVVAGAFTGMCLNEEANISCANIAWAAPFAIDIVYSLIRRSTVRPKVLVDKKQSSDSLQLGAPIDEARTDCESVAGVFVGTASGPSDEQRLNGNGGDRQRELAPGALQIGFDETGSLVLDSEALNDLAGSSAVSLWVQEQQSRARPVTFDRCTLLRPRSNELSAESLEAFRRDCPLPQPQQ